MNLNQWLYAREDPEEWKDRPQWQRKEYIYHSILSISSAVVFVHKEIEGFISSHHDIKPANIFLFGQTWKLADFGRSHLLRSTAASDTEGILGTYTYQPPEYRNSSGRKAEKRHDRAFDVWSLACIIIELLTIAVHGWNSQQLSLFHRRRTDNLYHPKRIPTELYGRDNSFFNNMHAVQDWTGQLLKNDGSPNLRSMLNIVRTMMIEEESHRYLSWEIHLDLYEFCIPTPRWRKGRPKHEQQCSSRVPTTVKGNIIRSDEPSSKRICLGSSGFLRRVGLATLWICQLPIAKTHGR